MDGITHNGISPLTSIINQINAPADLPTGQSDRVDFSTEVLSFQITLAFVRLIKSSQYATCLIDDKQVLYCAIWVQKSFHVPSNCFTNIF